ncbi:MAG: ribonuclease HII [Balneolaceae bacterium]
MDNKYHFEEILWEEGYKRIMGLDEVGRGCLSGPVVAAGVILKPGTTLPFDVRDSKKIQLKERKEFAEIIKREALFWSIQKCSPKVIDSINILNASIKAMQKCADQPTATPDYLLIDGNRFGTTLIPHKCIIKGDDKSASIGAASILAKVYRDNLMKQLHKEFPQFGWNSNVGYPTKSHFKGLNSHGVTEHHRKSFRLRTSKIYKSPVDTK